MVLSIAGGMTNQRYQEPSTGQDARNVEEFGIPEKTLYSSTELFDLHHSMEISEEDGTVRYRSSSKALSMRDKTEIVRADGFVVATVDREIFTMQQLHHVHMASGLQFDITREPFHLVKSVINIDGLGWIIEGNFMQLNFTLRDRDHNLIAVVGQKFMSIHDKYSVDLYRLEDEEIVVVILITLQHMICDRNQSSAAAAT